MRLAIWDELPRKIIICYEPHHYHGDVYTDHRGNFWYNNYGKYVDLPRQDQIQDMMECPEAVMGNLNCLQIFMNEYSPIDGWESMEQLWLAFYMKEKHNKRWENGKWMKQ